MKTYEKPRLMVLSISASDALCSGCQVGTRGSGDWSMFDTNGDGIFSRSDSYFSSGDPCETETEYCGYCKFSGADGYQLFTS